MSALQKFLKFFSTFFIVTVLALGIFFIRDKVNFSGKASGTPANLLVDLSRTYPTESTPWANLAQGGEEQGQALAAVSAKLRQLNVNYLRIDHVYDFFHVVSLRDGKISYNWSELDAYIKDIQSFGAKPFLSLSYMPQALGVNKDTDVPNDLAPWTDLVRATVEHVSGKAGLNIPDVYYEIWNEPDLFGNFKTYGSKNYLDLYFASQIGANNAKNTQAFKLGGPATTGLYQEWFNAMVKLSIEKNARFDFFTWHRYAEPLDNLEEDIKNVSLWRSAANQTNLKLFVTESGLDSANNPDYDTTKSAIHTIGEAAVTADTLNGIFSFEVKDGPGPAKYWGRWGLFTNEKWGEPTAKPRFNAFVFLNKMTGNARLNIAGVGSFVKAFAREENGVYRLLVVNFDQDAKHVEAVPIKFVGIPYAKIQVKRTDFGGGTTDIPAILTNKEWSTVQYFKVNSASIFEISDAK